MTHDLSPEFTYLVEGYHRFRANGWTPHRERWEQLRDGQHPQVMVIACSDSRCDPAQIFDVAPGEIFVVRNVSALVPPFETNPGNHGVSAALEFAVQILQVKEVVVMGHGMCGGCHAALTQDLRGAAPGEGGFIANWIAMLDDVREPIARKMGTTSHEAHRAMEEAGVKVSLANLRTFPCVRAKENEGSLRLRGTLFAISDGLLHILDETSGEFSPVN